MFNLEVRPNTSCPCNCRICTVTDRFGKVLHIDHIIPEGVEEFVADWKTLIGEDGSVTRLDVN